MIARMTAGTMGLIAFAAAIFLGLYIGNEPVTILERALSGMIVFLVLGAVIGSIAELVVSDHLKQVASQSPAADGHGDTPEAPKQDAEEGTPAAETEPRNDVRVAHPRQSGSTEEQKVS